MIKLEITKSGNKTMLENELRPKARLEQSKEVLELNTNMIRKTIIHRITLQQETSNNTPC